MKLLKTLLTAGLGLGLSLGGVEVLAAEESRNKTAKPSMMKNVFPLVKLPTPFSFIELPIPPSFKEEKYRPNLSLSGFYGQNDGSYGSLDVLYPIYQNSGQLVFLDLRGLIKKSPVKEFNIGGGYRWLSGNGQKLYGVYGFFDRKMSPNNNWFNQLTVGGELKTEQLKLLGLNTKDLSIGGNVYLPVGTKSYELARQQHAQATAYQGDKFVIDFGDIVDTEYALTGMDVEVGHAIPNVKGLKAYLGGYYFSHNKVDKVIGPRATLVYDFSTLMPKSVTLIDHLELETSIQNDKPRGTTWYVGLRLQMQLGSSQGKSKLKGLEKQLTAFVRRDLDVVDQQSTAFDKEGTWAKDNGQPYVGKIATTKEELAEITKEGSGIDIIGVRGVIVVDGDRNDIAADRDAAVVLLQGQSITGLGMTFTANGKEYTAKVVDTQEPVVGADVNAKPGTLTMEHESDNQVGHLLRVYTQDGTVDKSQAQIIQDLQLRVPAGDKYGQNSVAITNTKGSIGDQSSLNSFGDLVVNNVVADGAIYFSVDSNQSGHVTVKNSQISVANPILPAISIMSTSENDISIKAISGNSISVNAAGLAIGVYADYLNGPIKDNNFEAITSTGHNAYAIFVRNDITLDGSILDNTVNAVTSMLYDAHGVFVGDHISGSIKDNSMTVTAAGAGYGIIQLSSGKAINLDEMSGNMFEVAGGSSSIGLSTPKNLDATVATDLISRGNVFKGQISSHADIVEDERTALAANSLSAVIAKTSIGSSTSTFLGEDDEFTLIYDLKKTYNNVTPGSVGTWTLHGWTVVKAGLVAAGATGTDEQIEAFYRVILNAGFTGDFTDLSKAKVTYVDPEHYELQILSSDSSQTYYRGALGTAPAGASGIGWRLNYCTTPGDNATRYSTILTGSKNGNILTILPQSGGYAMEFPVGGSGPTAYVQVGTPIVDLTEIIIQL